MLAVVKDEDSITSNRNKDKGGSSLWQRPMIWMNTYRREAKKNGIEKFKNAKAAGESGIVSEMLK